MTDTIIIEAEPPIRMNVESDGNAAMRVDAAGELVLVDSEPASIVQITQDTELHIYTETEEVSMIVEAMSQEVIILEGFQVPSEGAANIAHIELELTMASGTINRHKVFEYDLSGNLVNQKVYTNNTLAQLLYDIDYTYASGDLTQISVTRISDAFSYTKNFTYSGGELESINYV